MKFCPNYSVIVRAPYNLNPLDYVYSTVRRNDHARCLHSVFVVLLCPLILHVLFIITLQVDVFPVSFGVALWILEQFQDPQSRPQNLVKQPWQIKVN